MIFYTSIIYGDYLVKEHSIRSEIVQEGILELDVSSEVMHALQIPYTFSIHPYSISQIYYLDKCYDFIPFRESLIRLETLPILLKEFRYIPEEFYYHKSHFPYHFFNFKQAEYSPAEYNFIKVIPQDAAQWLTHALLIGGKFFINGFMVNANTGVFKVLDNSLLRELELYDKSIKVQKLKEYL